MMRAVKFLAVAALLSLSVAGVADAKGSGPAIVVDPTSVDAAGQHDVTVTGSGFTIDVFVLQCPGAGGSVEALVDGDPTLLCDIGNLVTGSPDADGNFEVTFTGIDISDCGLVFVAGDLDQTEVGGPEVVTVDNPAADVECEVVEDAGYEDTSAAGASSELSEPAVEGDTTVEVTDESAFSVGDEITICPGCANEETNTVSGFGSIELESALQFDHEAGETVAAAGAVQAADDSALASTGTNTVILVIIAAAVAVFGGLLAGEARRLNHLRRR